jgi:Flp pilus assembly protein TadB
MDPVIAFVPGALVGLAGAAALAAAVRPAPFHLPAALARIDAHYRASTNPDPAPPGQWERLLTPLAVRAARSGNRWIGLPSAELDTCEMTATRHLSRRLAWAAGAAGAAGALVALAALLGLGLPTAIVPLLVLGAAVAGSAVPVLELAETARKRRAEFSTALAAYLDLVAQERAAGAATGPALLDAAAVSPSWPFRRLHGALLRAQHTGQPPWEALAELGERLHVPELGDVADIAATSADGAAVYTTLTTKAAALRRATLAADKAAANVATQRLTPPVTLLLVGLLTLVLFPALIRLAGM